MIAAGTKTKLHVLWRTARLLLHFSCSPIRMIVNAPTPNIYWINHCFFPIFSLCKVMSCIICIPKIFNSVGNAFLHVCVFKLSPKKCYLYETINSHFRWCFFSFNRSLFFGWSGIWCVCGNSRISGARRWYEKRRVIKTITRSSATSRRTKNCVTCFSTSI